MLNILSLGGGIQSTVLFLHPDNEFDYAIFADTGWEHPETYKNIAKLTEIKPEKLITIKYGDIHKLNSDSRLASMPLFVKNKFGKTGRLRRQCTSEYKINPVMQKIREIIKENSLPKKANLQLGISMDEIGRMKQSKLKWLPNVYPLIDWKWNREDCKKWLENNYDFKVVRSACIGCPFKNDKYWRELKKDENLWKEACEYDNMIRNYPKIDGECFLHRSLVPLEDLDFIEKNHVFSFINDPFLDECNGICGI